MTLTDIRRFIFDRLNTGGTKLNSQEIRNALNPGAFNKALIDITRLPLFTKIFGIPPYEETDPNDYYENPDRQKNNLYASMGDCQLVLRYFALKDDANIRGSMKSMLDRAMKMKITGTEGEVWKQDYQERLKFLYDLFDGRPFSLLHDKELSGKLSAAIYDASMVAIHDLWDKRNEIKTDKVNVPKRMVEAMGDDYNMTILTGKKNTANAVRERINLMRQILLPE